MNFSGNSGACVAGIDEAGYGPLLGPLVVGLAAFRVPDPRANLWRLLEDAVVESPDDLRDDDADDRFVVADSKLLFKGGDGLADLELAALAFSTLEHGCVPATAAEFAARHARGSAELAARYPWYGDGAAALELPRAATRERVLAAAARLARAAERTCVHAPLLRVRTLFEGEFNGLVDRYGTKARALFDQNVCLLDELRSERAGPFRVLCDRHGGRTRYAALLEDAMPMTSVAVVHEHDDWSAYDVGDGEHAMRFDYRVGAERVGLEAALASVFAKYTRELYVEVMNRHFATRVNGIRRTAGYWTDGQRFLRDLETARAISAEERALLVRRR